MAVKSYEATDADRSFFQTAETLSEKAKPVPWYKSLPSAAAKGLVKGTVGLGQIMSGTALNPDTSQSNEDLQTILDQFLPSEEGLGEDIASRSGEIFPLLATSGSGIGSSALRSGLAATGSQTAKNLGIGELGQAAAELPALLGPDLARAIPTRAGSRQEQLANFARNQGVEENELALMLGEQGRVKESLTHIAPRGGQTQRAFHGARDALNRVWTNLRQSPEAQTQLSQVDARDLAQNLAGRMKNLPAEQRQRAMQDVIDLMRSPMRGEDIINFWQDLNYYIPKGEAGLGVLKDDLSKALRQISPQLGEDFNNLNQLYGNYSRLHQQMRPSLVDQFFRAGEFGALAFGALTMDVPTLTKVLGEVSARELARQAIINPRLQNLSQRFVNAAQRSSPAIAKIAWDQFIIEVAKNDAETASKLSEFDPEAFSRALSENKGKEKKTDENAKQKL